MLFHLNLEGAVVKDIPMKAVYGDEISNLSVSKSIGQFFIFNLKNFVSRIKCKYFIRDLTPASLLLVTGVLLLLFGVVFGWSAWAQSIATDIPSTSGTVMIAGLPIMLGFQCILGFIQFDMASVPNHPLTKVK